jgi:hypothetical protein
MALPDLPDPPGLTDPHDLSRPPINRRSLFLGLCGVIFICALTPYNDYALNNTFLVGNNLPLGVVMFLFLFALLINGPLSRWKPAWAFSAGELTVALSMTLVSCALPSSGLMRYFPPSLVSPWFHAQRNPEFAQLADSLHLPKWIYPSFKGSTPSQWANDPIVNGYIGRWTQEGPPPYWAWVRPALTWGVFLFALYGAMLCMVSLLRRQWNENERLPFPLTQIYLGLLEQPPRGRFFNGLMRRRPFWIAFAIIFSIHIWNGCSQYWPLHFVPIPVHYDFWGLLSERPWVYLDSKMKDAAVFFTVVGVAYFLSGPVGFSLWFFYVLRNLYQMYLGMSCGDGTIYGAFTQHFGGVSAYALMILWIGRRHWRMILAQAFGRGTPGESLGRYQSNAVSFWCFIACTALMIAWLCLAGCTFFGATVMVLLLLTLFLIITRIIAETGLVHGQLQVGIYQPWQMISTAGWGKAVPDKDFFLGSLLQSVHYDFREVASVYASHALKVADVTLFANKESPDTSSQRRTGRKFLAALFLALAVGYFVSFASTLWTEYRYAWTQDISQKMPINDWGASGNSQKMIVDADVQYDQQNYHANFSQWHNWSFGFLLVALLGYLRLRFVAWPLHPVGFLMVYTYPGAHLWFSLMLGWLCKTLILRFGGSKLYEDAKPFFLGLIVGESMAAAFWLLISILLSSLSIPYRPINIMPG